MEATPEERRKLISPFIERVYLDVDSRLIGAIAPVAAFRTLLDKAMARAESTAVMLLSEDDTERLKVWSWWRRGRVFWTQPVNTVWVNHRDGQLDANLLTLDYYTLDQQAQELLTLFDDKFSEPNPYLCAKCLKVA